MGVMLVKAAANRRLCGDPAARAVGTSFSANSGKIGPDGLGRKNSRWHSQTAGIFKFPGALNGPRASTRRSVVGAGEQRRRHVACTFPNRLAMRPARRSRLDFA